MHNYCLLTYKHVGAETQYTCTEPLLVVQITAVYSLNMCSEDLSLWPKVNSKVLFA